MKRKKLHVMTIKDEAALSREEMKHIMAGSGGGGTNWVYCKYESQSCDACATYDGSSPYSKCVDVCGGWPQIASWGTSQGCTDGGWG